MEERLYLITPAVPDPQFADTLARVLDAGGVACVRLAMDANADAIRRMADMLLPVCSIRDVPLVIAEHIQLVTQHGLQGVHLDGAGVAAIKAARKALGANAIIGAGAGVSRHHGMSQAEAGADYVAFGPVHAGGLGDGREADADLFAWWDALIETPSVAEGGVVPADAGLRADFFAPRDTIWLDADGPAAALSRWQAHLMAGADHGLNRQN